MHKGLKKGIAVLAAAVLFCGSAPVDIYAANTVTISTRKDFLRFGEKLYLGQLVGRENRCADGGY